MWRIAANCSITVTGTMCCDASRRRSLPASGRVRGSTDDGDLRVVMLACTLLAAIDSAIELFAAPVFDWRTAVAEAVLLAAMAAGIARPVAGSVLLGVTWCVAFPLPVGLSMSLSVVIALPLVVLSYRRTVWGIALMGAAMASRIVQLCSLDAFPDRPMWWRVLTVMPWLAMPLVVPVMAGVLLRWRRIRRQRAAEARRRTEAMGVAARLHDSTTNELSYLIMDIDHLLGTPEAGATVADSLRRMRATAGRALEQTHAVIAMLREGSADTGGVVGAGDDSLREGPASVSSGEGAGAVSARGRADSVRGLVDRCRRDAAALGIVGETVVTDPRWCLDRLDAATGELIRAVIRELFANIMKHANPAAGYVVAVTAGLDKVCVSCADVPQRDVGGNDVATQNNRGGLGMGFGLDHLRASAEARGGRFEVRDDAGYWSCAVTVPFLTGREVRQERGASLAGGPAPRGRLGGAEAVTGR